MSVTAQESVQSRNAPCSYCERLALGYVLNWGECCKLNREAGRKVVGLYWTHCTTCHDGGHNACLECGECLPAYEGDTTYGYLLDSHKNYRCDRVYCSNACRQKAYRNRKATAA